jgi:hypothetical protein
LWLIGDRFECGSLASDWFNASGCTSYGHEHDPDGPHPFDGREDAESGHQRNEVKQQHATRNLTSQA